MTVRSLAQETPTPNPSPQEGGEHHPHQRISSGTVEGAWLPESPSPLRGGVRGGGKIPQRSLAPEHPT